MKHPNILAASSAAAIAMGATVSSEIRPAEFGGKDGGGEIDIKQLSRELKAATDKVNEFAVDAKGRLEKGEELSKSAKQSADEALVKFNELSATMTDIEQKLARFGSTDGENARKSVGAMMTADENIKAFMERAPSKGSIQFATKAIITSATTDANGSAGDLIVPDRRDGIVAPPERRMTVRDLITPGRTSSNAIQFVQETGFVNNAAPQGGEGAQKAQSDIKFDLKTLPVATIAHWVQASRQILSDAPMLESYVDGRLRYGLAYAEELQFLKGDGTGSNLLGMIPQATAYSAPGGLVHATMIDQLRYAMLQAVLAEYPATGHVLNPIDWARIETTKNDVGEYIIGNAADGAEPRLWRLPVVETPAMTVDKFLTGAFKLACQYFDREDATLELSTEDRDNFIKNLVTILAEQRVGLAVYRPEALIYGDFGNVA